MSQVVKIKWQERWEVYYRLQELDIPCQCDPNQPLEVQVTNTKSAIQLWSVVQNLRFSRAESINWLNHCWNLSNHV